MKLGQFVEEFLIYCKVECYYSQSTINAYKTDLSQFLRFVNRKNNFKKIANKYFDWVLNTTFTDRTKARKISTIKVFLNYLINENVMTNEILNIVPDYKFSNKLIPVIDKNIISKLINLVDKSSRNGFRDYLLLELLYSTGLRVSECVTLKYSDIDFVQGTIKVTGKGAKQRIIPMTNILKNIFQSLKYDRSDLYIFTNSSSKPLSRQSVFLIVKKYWNQLNEVSHSMSPHSFRHAFASHMLEGGARLRDVQILLGHTSISSTQHYLKLSDSYRKKVFLQSHPRGEN